MSHSLFAHLKSEYLKELQCNKIGDFLPHPLPVCNFGFHQVFLGFNSQGQEGYQKILGFELDNSRLEENTIIALYCHNWHKVSRYDWDNPYLLNIDNIHHLSL